LKISVGVGLVNSQADGRQPCELQKTLREEFRDEGGACEAVDEEERCDSGKKEELIVSGMHVTSE